MKTIKQLAKEYADSRGSELLSSIDIELAFENGVKAAQEWISSDKELPECDSPVLVKTEMGWIVSARLVEDCDRKRWYVSNSATLAFDSVKLWRPIEYM